jgi:hypothetical protein
VKIALLIAALPVYVLGMALAAGGAAAIFFRKKGRMVLPIAAAALLLMGAIFFMLGVSQLADLVGYPDDLTFAAGFYVMLIGFVPAMVTSVLVAYGNMRFGTDEEEESQQVEAAPIAENTITDDDTVRKEDEE